MERSITRTAGELIATTMVLIGSALIGAGNLRGIVLTGIALALIGMLVMLHVTGAFVTTARAPTGSVRQGHRFPRRRSRR